jgi:excisionase family DNA binding protein
MLTPAATPDPGGDEDEVLTPREVARLFGVEPKTVTKWAKTGRLPSFLTLGGHRRYYASDIRDRLPNANRTP